MVDVQTKRLTNLYFFSNTSRTGPPVTGFCRPAVRRTLDADTGKPVVAVSAWHGKTRDAEVLDPNEYVTNGVQPDEAWPMAGEMGIGQLQWRPRRNETDDNRALAQVEFDEKKGSAVLKVVNCPMPGPPQHQDSSIIAVLNASIDSGEPRWYIRPLLCIP